MSYADLIERLEKLEGPDREADADIYIALHIPAERIGRLDRLGGCVGWWPKDAPYVSAIDVPAYTASLDAAVALVARVLPGCDWAISSLGEDGSSAEVWRHGWHDDSVIEGHHPLPAIALLISTLKALQEVPNA